jgi:hypothetical protein
MKESKVIFDTRKLAAEMMKNLSAEQTNRLIEYAKQTILEIGNKIQTYHSRNHMYRSGHLLRSLCCGVSYDGKLVYSGFYGDIALKSHTTWNEANTTNSYLHEWIPEYEAFQIDGRQMAQNYIQRYGSAGSGNKTWRVFFAILAPYWGYWETGFNMVHGLGKNRKSSFHQFAVMTEFYDKVGKDLKPAKVKFQITKDMNYTKSYHVKSIKGHKGYVRGTIERRYDNWMKKHK